MQIITFDITTIKRHNPAKMSVLWKYLKPQKGLIIVALILAGISQLLNLVDPLIFGKIIDDYALNPSNIPEKALVRGVAVLAGGSGRCRSACPGCQNLPGLFRTAGRTEVRDADIQ